MACFTGGICVSVFAESTVWIYYSGASERHQTINIYEIKECEDRAVLSGGSFYRDIDKCIGNRYNPIETQYQKGFKMRKRKQKRIKTGEERCLLFDLYHNGLYRQKVIANKKKKNDRKTWRNKLKEGYPLNILALQCA